MVVWATTLHSHVIDTVMDEKGEQPITTEDATRNIMAPTALYLMSVRPVWHPAGKRIYTAIVLRCSGGPKGDNMTKLSATKVFGGHTFL